jgi:hypothetical protein
MNKLKRRKERRRKRKWNMIWMEERMCRSRGRNRRVRRKKRERNWRK